MPAHEEIAAEIADLDPRRAEIKMGDHFDTTVKVLLAAGISRTLVAWVALNTPEGHQAQVQRLYQEVLRRPADGSGLGAFVAALQHGARTEHVLATLVGSDEYAQRFVGSPAAFVNAVVDALAHAGVREIQMPMGPDKVWEALAEAGLAE